MLSYQTCPNEHTCAGLGATDCLAAVPVAPVRARRAAIVLNRIRLALAIVAHVVWRLLTWRRPSLSTYLLPTRSGGADGGPMCWPTGEVGDSACSPEGEEVCWPWTVARMVVIHAARRGNQARGLRFPVLVVVERMLAAGWTMRRSAVMGAG